MLRRDFRTDVEEVVLGHAELVHDRLGLHLGLAEVAALRLGNVLGLGAPGAKLDGGVAVGVHLATGDDLKRLELEDGDRHMPTVVLEQAGHPHFLRDHAGTHDLVLPYRGTRGTIPKVLVGSDLFPRVRGSGRTLVQPGNAKRAPVPGWSPLAGQTGDAVPRHAPAVSLVSQLVFPLRRKPSLASGGSPNATFPRDSRRPWEPAH